MVQSTEPADQDFVWTNLYGVSAAQSTVDRVDGPSIFFRLLGPLEIHGPDGPVQIASGRQEVVLAMLLLELNRVVPSEALVDAIWEENPPDTARAQVQICVSRIRKTLKRAGDAVRLVTRNRGYVLEAEHDVTDLAMFRRHVVESDLHVQNGRDADAAALLRSAVALWHGDCLSGIASGKVARRAQGLDEERLSAIETHLELELGLGRHHQLIGELVQLVAEHPLRERLRGYLMLALYRADRQAEALAVYRTGREVLADELGLEPSQSLRMLETAILAGDPALDFVSRAFEPPEAVAPVEIPAGAPVAAPTGPRQLPADIADFVGRKDLVENVERAIDHRSGHALAVAVLTGRPGVGKRTTATHIAHRLSERRFPDGQLYCDLRGMHPDRLKPEEVLRRFLLALGVPGVGLPRSLDELAEMYRAALAEQRVLVVLEDVADEAQLAPLLPGSAACAVIATSHARLTAVPGAHVFEMEPFDADPALELLGRVIGPGRVTAEPEAATALLRIAGGLPLALRIVAARLAARPHWKLATMVARLGDEQRYLDELAHGEMTVRASLSVSYNGLAAADRKLLQLLSLAEGPTLPEWLAGALLDGPAPYVADAMEPLVDMHMLEVVGIDAAGPFRYRFHQTTRLFAQDKRIAECSAESQQEGIRRMIGGWMSLAEQAHRQIYGGDHLVLHGSGPRWHPPQSYVRSLLADPMTWFETELPNLCAAVKLAARAELDELCWDLATTLVTVFEARGHIEDWESTHRLALTAVRRAGNQRGTAAVLASLGALYLAQRRLDEADTSLTTALATFDQLSDDEGRGLCLRDLAFVRRLEGRDDQALELYDQAAAAFGRSGDVVGRASVLTQSAHIWTRRGQRAEARARLDEALTVYRSVGYQRGQSLALWRLGQLFVHDGELEQAEQVLHEALALVEVNQDLIGAAHVLHCLGDLDAHRGNDQQAANYLSRAVSVWEQLRDPHNAAVVRLGLARALAGLGRRGEAEALVMESIATFQESGMTADLHSARRLLTSLTND
ncbi:AfsR/SARP family transcriptional regulator [Amycolatopsis sp. GM8]|uniref:AfsR/SARP family transcriptional regulator n=1 Tax=Amycolatopsis sp. GM8 TaxID=2896530 RepID=UPI001F48E159|nr:AfsR/SARP family transcriptional regulator [Amycolatopsis sp. GM8]